MRRFGRGACCARSGELTSEFANPPSCKIGPLLSNARLAA